MSRIVLHIGTHKTATTSIQKFLFHNRATLAERGVFYPDYSLIGRKAHYAHLGMVNALSGRHNVYPVEAAEKFFSKVREQAANYDTTVISAEPFYRHVLNAPDDSPEYEPEAYWPLRDAYIDKIRDIFGEAQVVVVFRRQAEYAQSLYQEHVKVTRYKGNFRTFLNAYWFHFAFLEQAKAWDRAFPGTKAIQFDSLVDSGDAVMEFCRLLGLPIQDLEQPPRANEGWPVDMVILKRLLHRTDGNKDEARKNIEALEGLLSPETLTYLKSRSFFRSRDELEEFQSSFVANNELLRPFLLGASSDLPVFPTKTKPNLQFGDQLKPAILSEMLDLALNPTTSET